MDIIFQSGEFYFQESSNWLKTLAPYLLVLISFFLGLLSNRILDKRRENKRLQNVKNSIVFDLKRQQEVIKKVKVENQKLKQKLENMRQEKNRKVTISALETFFSDVFKANSLTDYFNVFNANQKYVKLFEIYKAIDFLVENSPYSIYNTYLNKLEKHLESVRERDNHDFFCLTHQDFLNLTIGHLENNLKAISDLEKDIEQFLKNDN